MAFAQRLRNSAPAVVKPLLILQSSVHPPSPAASPRRLRFCFVSGLWVLACLQTVAATLAANSPAVASDAAALDRWLAHQTNIQTWSADFVQTRKLKALIAPLTTSGHVWFKAPHEFRWELGNPPQTIALRQPDRMWVIYPRLKRAERFSLTGSPAGPWKDALALFEAGFPRSLADLKSRFLIVSNIVAADNIQLVLKPRSVQARKLIRELHIEFRPRDSSLASTEITFSDGSSMRNDFESPKINLQLDPQLFAPRLESDFKIVDPLQKP